MEFENASPASLFALHVYHPSMRFDVFENVRVETPGDFLIVASGESSPLLNVHDIAGRGTPLAMQVITVSPPS